MINRDCRIFVWLLRFVAALDRQLRPCNGAVNHFSLQELELFVSDTLFFHSLGLVISDIDKQPIILQRPCLIAFGWVEPKSLIPKNLPPRVICEYISALIKVED